ncbi:MAG: hypothetical protein AAF266_15955, partial [Planctomycetota bacterium]
VASLEIAELGIAMPVAAEPPAEEVPVAAETIADPSQATAAETETTPERPPTVAEWLRQSETLDAPPQPAPPEPTTPTTTPSLSESLGWNPAGFQLNDLAESPTDDDSLANAETISLPADPDSTPAPATTEPSDEFRFDFTSSPLAEQAAEEVASTPVDDSSFDRPIDATDESDEAADLAALLAGATRPQPRRSWAGPLSMAAGLLLIAAPAAYFAVTWQGEGAVADASANRGRRLADVPVTPDPEPARSTLPFGDDDFAADTVTPAAEEPAELPIQDPSTQPASYEAPATDRPPDPFPAEGTIDTPVAPIEEAMPQEELQSASVGDRYASISVNSVPNEFALPEDEFAPADPEPAAAGVEPASLTPIERTPLPEVGLVNAPRYSTQQLLEAYEPAVPAGRGFAEGTLDDPTQVSAMGQHYARLCYLAQVLTLIDPAEKQGGVFTAELEAADVFKRLFREAGPRAESRKIAGPWISWTGRPHGGVFFAGVPEEMEAVGEVIQYRFKLGEVEVPVVMADRIDVDRFINAAAREVGVIGVVVENPRDWIAGYEGDADRVVWVRKTLPLKAPRQL